MTVFSATRKESLHGHDYRVGVMLSLRAPSLDTIDSMVPFSDVKSVIRALCEAWDEKVLLPRKCPHLKVSKTANPQDVDVTICSKHYVFPSDEVVWIDTDNITIENLSRNMGEVFVLKSQSLFKPGVLLAVRLSVSESFGQSAEWLWEGSNSHAARA